MMFISIIYVFTLAIYAIVNTPLLYGIATCIYLGQQSYIR